MDSAFSLRKTIRGPVPRIVFSDIAKDILGPTYQLSLVITADTLMRRLNRDYRKKDYATNVLAFPLSEHEGEIFINVRKAEKEARTLNTTAKKRIAFLFIHACLHLKGHDHGGKMEALEKLALKKWGF